jgi:hypothetical protein
VSNINLDESMSTITKKGEKVMITGDDVLIEYCDRVAVLLKSVGEAVLNDE